MSIISMFKAMTDKHKQDFLKQVEGISKWQLDKYPDDYLIKLKINAQDIRDQEKDMERFTPEAKAKKAKRNIREDKAMSKAYDYQKAESARSDAEYEEYLKESDPEAYAEHMHWKEIKNL